MFHYSRDDGVPEISTEQIILALHAYLAVDLYIRKKAFIGKYIFNISGENCVDKAWVNGRGLIQLMFETIQKSRSWMITSILAPILL